MEKKVMSSTTKGLIIGLVLCVIALAMYFVTPDLASQQKYGWISSLIVIGAAVWASISYAKEMDGNVTFGNAFSHGFKTTAVFTIIVILYSVLSFTVLFPELKDKMLDTAAAQMEKEGKLTAAQIEQALAMTKKFLIPFTIGGILISYLIMGAIGSLIGAAVAKKNPTPAPFQ